MLTQGDSLAKSDREIMANAWLKAGLAEHASIASFSRFTIQLMQLGAPMNLVKASAKAMEDEINHSTLCFDMAHYWSDKKRGPGALETSVTVDHRERKTDIIFSTLVEGCIGETISAELALEGSKTAADDKSAETLRLIARDEQRHAELGWDFVSWSVKKFNDIRVIKSKLLDEITAELPDIKGKRTDTYNKLLYKYGILTGAKRQEVVGFSLEKLIVPRLKEMLS